jgi:hypothetical protein
MESPKIVFTCIVAAILYGIVHDQFTARICIEYFTIFHPPVFATRSPTLPAFAWGIIATWWVGAFLGLLLVFAARAGSRPKLAVAALLRPIGKLRLVMAVCAAISGLTGFLLARRGLVVPPEVVLNSRPPSAGARFMADWWRMARLPRSGSSGALFSASRSISAGNACSVAERGESFSPFTKTFEKRLFSNVFSHFPISQLLSGGEYRPS